MRDAVALAYSGRIPEARAEATDQASNADEFVAGQGLEALGVLGREHGVRSTPDLDAVLERRAREGGAIARRAFEAAGALESRALESVCAERLAAGDVTWDVLRYAGELPSLRLARALAEGWERLPARMRDEALLVTRVLPVADRAECEAWGRRLVAQAESRDEEVRRATFLALWTWRPDDAGEACARALEDDASAVREAAAQALAVIDLDLLVRRAVELEDRYPEPLAAVPFQAAMKLADARRRRFE